MSLVVFAWKIVAPRADITDYIVGFYNCKRINSALGNLPPTVYERKMAAREPIVVSEIT